MERAQPGKNDSNMVTIHPRQWSQVTPEGFYHTVIDGWAVATFTTSFSRKSQTIVFAGESVRPVDGCLCFSLQRQNDGRQLLPPWGPQDPLVPKDEELDHVSPGCLWSREHRYETRMLRLPTLYQKIQVQAGILSVAWWLGMVVPRVAEGGSKQRLETVQ